MTDRAWVTLFATVAGWLLCYLIACLIWPWARCTGEWLRMRQCDAGRVYQNPQKKTWRDCRRCKGTGRRRRFGRALWARFVQAKRRAER